MGSEVRAAEGRGEAAALGAGEEMTDRQKARRTRDKSGVTRTAHRTMAGVHGKGEGEKLGAQVDEVGAATGTMTLKASLEGGVQAPTRGDTGPQATGVHLQGGEAMEALQGKVGGARGLLLPRMGPLNPFPCCPSILKVPQNLVGSRIGMGRRRRVSQVGIAVAGGRKLKATGKSLMETTRRWIMMEKSS